jgi:flavorubredoxin
MARILVVYCSLSGNTKAAAGAVADGARSANAEVTVRDALEAQPSDLMACDAIALGSYDAFSYMGGGLKDFFDRAFYPTQSSVTDKPYAVFVSHGGGGKAVLSIESVAEAFKLKKVAESTLFKGHPDSQAIAQLKALGAKLAVACRK